jgi:hypothetical protein
MDSKTKAKIITDFLMRNAEEEKYDDFFDYNDLGLPLAVAFNANICILNNEGETILKETYNLLCDELGADSEKEFKDLDELLQCIE